MRWLIYVFWIHTPDWSSLSASFVGITRLLKCCFFFSLFFSKSSTLFWTVYFRLFDSFTIRKQSARSIEMRRLMGKPTICTGENKGFDQLRSNCQADQRLCFHYTVSTMPLLSKPKFPVSSHLLCLYSSVCVRPVWKPHCWFSHEVAQI